MAAEWSLPDAARFDRAVLASALSEHLGRDHGRRIAHEVATFGLRLHPASGQVGSRLGGSALLPPGEDWPARADGPLAFLGGIALAELPVHGHLPESGWLLFFADLDGDRIAFAGQVRNQPGAGARVLYVPPGVDPVDASTPAGLNTVLSNRPVAAVAQLTLPDDYDAAERLGLSDSDTDAYADLAGALRHGPEGWSPHRGAHWMLGECTGVQGHPPPAGSVLLLHIAYDQELGFEFLDAGAIQYRISLTALEARDWTATVAYPDSG